MKFVFLILFLFFARPAWAVPVFDGISATATDYVETATDTFSSHSITSSSPYVFACISVYDVALAYTVTGGFPKLDGTSMTLIGSAQNDSGSIKTYLYGIQPGSGGVKTYEMSFNSFTVQHTSLISYSGASVTLGTPNTAADSTDIPTVDIASATGEVVVDCLTSRDDSQLGWTAGLNQTQRVSVNSAGFWWVKSSQEAGGTTTTMSWQLGGEGSEYWAIVGVSLKPATVSVVRHRPVMIQ